MTTIPVRRLDVDMANAPIGEWIVPNDAIFSHFMAALSGVFPAGEDFFVHSVKNYRDRFADDPEMKAKVKGFIGQESMHGREHRALNEKLASLGYPMVAYDAGLVKVAKRLARYPKSWQIATTAASEHFTAVLAWTILSDDLTRTTLFSAPDFDTLLTWHALEELEHKDVAFDVMQGVSRSYPLRLVGVVLAATHFGPVVARGMVRSLVRDSRKISLRQTLRTARRQHMVGLRAGRELIKYANPRFHPRDIDTDALIEEWRDRLAPKMSSVTRTGGAA